jgi:uncharacterized membrane protein YdjX (TVP38/TMEM64 family)
MHTNNRKPSIWALALLFIALAALGYVAFVGVSSVFDDPEELYAQIDAYGIWGPVVVAGLQTLQVLFAPIPGQVVGMAAGYLYGVVWGSALSLAGLGLGSWLAILLARRLGRPLVLRVARPETIERLDNLSQRHGLWAFFLVFLLPFLPTDVGCFVAGLTPLPIPILVILALIGRLPGVILLNWLGATSQTLGGSAIAALATATLIGALLMVRYRAQLQEAMFVLMKRFGVE